VNPPPSPARASVVGLDRRAFLAGAAGALFASAAIRTFPQVAQPPPTGTEPEASHPPSADDLAVDVRQVFSSDDPALIQFAAVAYADCIFGKIRPASPPLSHPFLVPGGGYFAQWLWDTMFVVDLLSILPGQESTIRGVFQNYWDFQERWNAAKPDFMHGMIANFIAPFDGAPDRDGRMWRDFPAYSQAPLLAWGMERVYRRTGDLEMLRQGLQPLESFHEWYWRERDIRDLGLVGVGSYSGDVQHARYETYDHEVDLDRLQMIPHPARARGSANGAWYGDIAIPANTSYLLLSEQSLARLADRCGNSAMAVRRRARYAKGSKSMRRHMWDSAAGCFLAVNVNTLAKIKTPTVGSFVPIMAEVATRKQARRMAAALDSPHWQTPLPIPTVARNAPEFVSGEFWRGDVWPVPNYQVATGLAHYGLRETAARLCDATVANALKVGISERYDSLTGEPLGVRGLGMSATVLTMMIDGLTSSRYALRVNPPTRT
jgi:putative isomerase